MRTQQILIALVCLLLTQDIAAVVNTPEADTNAKSESSSSTPIADSVAASSEKEATRREAPIPHEVYGPPPDTYIPSAPSNPGLPVPVYGVPDTSNNIIYPGPPADIAPLSINYGPPKSIPGKYGPPPLFPKPPKPFNPPPFHKPKPFYGPPRFGPVKPHFNKPKINYGPPKPQYGPPKPQYGPPKPLYGPPKPHYGPPKDLYGPPPGPPKEFYGPPKDIYGPPPKEFYGPPKDIYGPPKEIYGPPKEIYGPPKDIYGPPKEIYGPPKEIYGPPKEIYGPPKEIYGPPKDIYGPPKDIYGPPKEIYGPPKEIYGPPKEIYGPPKEIYGPPKDHGPPKIIYGPPKHHYGPPEPIPHGPPHPGAPAPPTPPDIKYDGWQPIPGLVSRPPQELHFNDFVPPPPGQGVSSLSLGSSYGNSAGISDSYGAPLNTVTGSGGIVSTSGDAHIQNQDQSAITLGLSAAGIGGGHDGQLSVIKSIGYEIFPHGSVLSDSYSAPPSNSYSAKGPYPAPFKNNFGKGIGLIPPSGLYGVPPSGNYGTPLLTSSLNALDVNPPKHPIIFREPVPHGLIQSIGNHVAQNDAAGIIESSFNGPAYIPPPVPELSFSKPELSGLHSLPFSNHPISFHAPQSAALTLNSFSQGTSVSIDHSHPPTNIDLTHYGVPFNGAVHDCQAYKSQPLPQLSYGVPSANTYTASLSSLKANIGNHVSYPSLAYGSPDLQAAHSQTGAVNVNSIDDKEQYGKSLAESFAPGGEVIKSQSIDFNNIPVQGALGSYTLQIQPANGETQVPHDQVLNDGLLQSILAAIEQPQQNVQIFGQEIPQIPNGLQLPSNAVTQFNDGVGEHSVKNPVVVSPPEDDKEQKDESLQLIDNNEIALYFHNNSSSNSSGGDDVRNGQQYGSYVSFKTPNTSYVYGELKGEE